MREHPGYRMFAGAFLILGMFVAACFTILTDESLIRGGNGDVPLSWAIVQQPYDLLNGMYSGLMAWSIIGAWLIFGVYLMFSVINYFADDPGLRTVIWGLITLDSIGNFVYFKGMETVWRLLITGLVFFALTYGGKKGFILFFSGFNEIRASREARHA